MNRKHIALHCLENYQIEELYYSEGIYRTLLVKNKKNVYGEQRYKLIGIDAGGTFIKAIISFNFSKKCWRCITAVKMSDNEKRTFLKYIGVK